ncbi:nucleoside-diphosphate sugar epimerase [Mannheimia sp. USDA-ARS-USMARC-1261]|uniref:TIGR01777 family oxidoreductase n=1 Tax=Mannheimia sp. USDA-ARS-USMARC-1261 TaxID=1432056 RepID=UPI0003E31E6C|nr:TIGR01777 family oxidoreductase [Mannheimia sp. USDA-ARS-USMARC-1261]AHG73977.1 nucleoside-diphosphate sugar epimerase [Mannheimia sp. USDA-ARS-USMARC-1261]
MNILITGGTGFIGTELIKKLKSENHHFTLLVRNKDKKSDDKRITHCYSLDEFSDLNDFDAVINLAGEPIFDKRWTEQQKRKLIESRVKITNKLSELINASVNPPHTFLSGSAIGIYGDLPKSANFYTESTACYQDCFTNYLCQQWEAAALKAESDKTRVCLIRTGTVFSPEGGALKKILPIYRCGLGGKLGSGKQYWAWISRRDHVQAVIFLLKNANCSGVYNFVAPNPVRNEEFNRILANAVNRPAFFAVPEFALKLGLGERACLVLDNQQLIPEKLLAAGFEFQDPILTENIFLNP